MSSEQGGDDIGPSRPIHLTEKIEFKLFLTSELQWGGAPVEK